MESWLGGGAEEELTGRKGRERGGSDGMMTMGWDRLLLSVYGG